MTKRAQQERLSAGLLADGGPRCVGYRVRMLSRVVSALYEEAFSPLQLKISQFSILAILGARGGCTAAELCRVALMDKSTASRNLQRMKKRGWITPVSGTNGRAKELALTRAGARLMRSAYPQWRKAQGEAMRRLGPAGSRALDGALAAMRD